MELTGEQGLRSAESTHLNVDSFDSEVSIICGLSLSLVFILVTRGFSPDTQVFPSPQKPIQSGKYPQLVLCAKYNDA